MCLFCPSETFWMCSIQWNVPEQCAVTAGIKSDAHHRIIGSANQVKMADTMNSEYMCSVCGVYFMTENDVEAHNFTGKSKLQSFKNGSVFLLSDWCTFSGIYIFKSNSVTYYAQWSYLIDDRQKQTESEMKRLILIRLPMVKIISALFSPRYNVLN